MLATCTPAGIRHVHVLKAGSACSIDGTARTADVEVTVVQYGCFPLYFLALALCTSFMQQFGGITGLRSLALITPENRLNVFKFHFHGVGA